jgi:hypothetical protein
VPAASTVARPQGAEAALTDRDLRALAWAFAWVAEARKRGAYEQRVALLHLRDELPTIAVLGEAANGNDDAENDDQMAPGWR